MKLALRGSDRSASGKLKAASAILLNSTCAVVKGAAGVSRALAAGVTWCDSDVLVDLPSLMML